MASLSDYYTPAGAGGKALPFELADIGIQQSDMNVDAGTALDRQGVQFGRNMTSLVNAYSSRGTARGGQAGVAADQLRNDFDFQQSQTRQQQARQNAMYGRNKILATLGTMI